MDLFYKALKWPVISLLITGAAHFTLEAIWQVLSQRFNSRKVPLQNMKRGSLEKAGGNTVRQEVKITQSIDQDTARKITAFIKKQGYKKVQSTIQGDEVQVTSASKDDLQAVIAFLRTQDFEIELKFGNYRK